MTKVAFGIDIGGTYTKLGIVDESGHCLVDSSISTYDHKEINTFLLALKAEMERLKNEINGDIEVVGIGIGAPNANYYKGTIEHAPNLNWKGIIPFVEKFKLHYNLPIFLTNDANAAAIGEMIYGVAKNFQDFIVITLGTGLGSGIVARGKLVYGHDGFAGELGHIIVDKDGREGTAGINGTLESYVSATGMKRTIFEFMANSIKESELREIPFSKMTSKKIYDAAKKGDELALEAFRYTGEILGRALATAVNHTSPEAIILFGGLAKAGEFLIDPTKRYMEEYLIPIYKNKIKIIPSALTDTNAAVLGASALVWNELAK